MVGKIIVIEGIDGAGKATQVKLLKQELEKAGKKVSTYSYPDYSSVYGERIKSFLYKKIDINVDELFLLYQIDMVKDRSRILKAIEEEQYVVMDRYVFSTIAYQSAGGFDYETAKKLVKFIGMPVPDVVFYVDISADISMYRKEKQKGKIDIDKFESNKSFLSRVSSYYKKLLDENFYSKKWERIDGNLNIEEINDLITKKLNEL
jgi:dTMP kinase